MSSSIFTATATGDSLMVAPFPKDYATDLARIRDYMADADLRATNLETNLGAFGGYASAYSGGTWLNTEPEAFESMLGYGFNFYGTANNHSMDYSFEGMLSTIRELKKRKLAFAGTGRSLAEAAAPAIIKTPNGTAAVIAVTTSFDNASRAGRKSLGSKARPGVNYVRSTRYFRLAPADLKALQDVAKATGINAYRELLVRDGFDKPDPDGVYTFGGVKFCFDGSKKDSECNKADLARVTDAIRQAKARYDYVFVLVHCHEIDGTRQCEVPEFLRELTHACVDAGAAAIFGGGAHELRPLEIYAGAPIFYSLGDFIYQGMRVKYLPADFMEKYGVRDDATAYEGLMARSRGGKIGLQANVANFLTVVPKMRFSNGRLVSLEMLPVDLAFARKDFRNGLPRKATGKTMADIFARLDALSRPYGTSLALKSGEIVVNVI